MAIVIGGIGGSHTHTIGFAVDRNKQDDPVWAPIFESFAPLRERLEHERAEVLLFIHNDHVTSFFFDHYSAFALGVGERWEVADEGGGPRDLPAISGDPAFAAHLGRSLMADDFDLSFFQRRPLDHGCFSPLSILCRHDADGCPCGSSRCRSAVLQFPIPTARGAATSSARRSGARSRAIRSRCAWRWSPPAASRISCTASAPASTIRHGTSASSSSAHITN